MLLSGLNVHTHTSHTHASRSNPFRRVLAAGLLFTVLMFLVKLAAATLIEGEQLQPLLQWLGRSGETRTGLQPALPATPGASEATTPRMAPRYQWQALPEVVPSPPSNPWTPEKARLGKRLFFDRNLSLDRSVSCASCHDSERFAGADGRATAVGVGNQSGPRNSPTVWNTAFQHWLFWDGRAASLEEQALGPLLNPIEMAMPSAAAVVERVQEQASYQAAFQQAFGEERNVPEITIERILAAMAAYERTLITPDSPYDRYVRGDTRALSRQQLRGMALFEKLGCVNCHSGPNFSGAGVLAHNTPWRIFPALDTPFEQQYRLTDDVGKAPAGSRKGVWRIPSLRNVADTAPYFHNGSVTELAEAVRIMASAQLGYRIEGVDDAAQTQGAAYVWSPQANTLATVQPRQLGEDDIQSIVAFLQALSAQPTSEMDF